MQSAVRTGSDNLLAIQILRAIAALSVCIVHFQIVHLMLTGHQNDTPSLYPLAAGVDLFFIISGFVMVYSSESLFGLPNSPGIFFARRLARIVPLYWLTTIIGIYLESTPVDISSLVKSYLFIPFISQNGNFGPLYGVGWTLNFEMLFYILFSGAILLRRELAVMTASFALVSIVILGRIFERLPAPLEFWSDPIVIEFVFGMTLAIAYRKGIRLSQWTGTALCIGAAIAMWHAEPRPVPSGNRWFALGIPATIFFAGLAMQPVPSVIRWLGRLGDASYAIYLLHSLVLAAVVILWPQGLNRYPIWLVLSGGFLITVLASVGVFLYFERPVNRLLRRKIEWHSRQKILTKTALNLAPGTQDR
jgi:peptidoglycan/LPS O-acetylase OafA/YrhL